MNKESNKKSISLFECLKIYFNIIIAIEYLNKIGLTIEYLSFKDFYINHGKNKNNLKENPGC